MANKLLLKRSAVPGKVPALADLQLGELGVNTYDGKLYLRKDTGTPSIIEVGGSPTIAWGSITGTLSNQTDLQAALISKFSYTGWIDPPGNDANTMTPNRSGFTYANNAPHWGPIVRFDGGTYDLELHARYNDGREFLFRTHNSDGDGWNSWRRVWHDGNFTPGSAIWGNIGGTLSNQTDLQNALNGKPNLSTDNAFAGTNGFDRVFLNNYNGGLRINDFQGSMHYWHGPGGGGDDIISFQRYGTRNYRTTFFNEVAVGSSFIENGAYLVDKYAQLNGRNSFSNDNSFNASTYLSAGYQLNNGVPRNNLGNPTIAEMALFDGQFTNKLWFYDPTKLTFEKSTDGSTWVNDPQDIENVRALLSGGGEFGAVQIPNGASKYRITIENDDNYVFLNALYMFQATQDNPTQVQVWRQRSDNGIWEQHTFSQVVINSWPGHLYLPFDTITFNRNNGEQFRAVRIEFTPTWNNTYNIVFHSLEIWGGYPAGKRTIYSWDRYRNVAFPADLSVGGVSVHNASVLTFGTLDDARLSGNIPRKDVAEMIWTNWRFGGPGMAISGHMYRTQVYGDHYYDHFFDPATSGISTGVLRARREDGGLVELVFNGGGALSWNGQTIWHAGNFNPANYSLTSHNHDGAYVSIGTTGLGLTGNVGLDSWTDTPAKWSNLPVGYARMMNNGLSGSPGGNYGYFIKVANRDSSGGWGGLWIGYDGYPSYIGQTSTGASFATWQKIWTDWNFNPADYAPVSHNQNWNTITAKPAASTWAGTDANDVVSGMLSWRNYGNGHVIFDASAGVAPNGATVNNSNSQNAWTAAYGCLMGWNGSQTYGVRVDSARRADSAASADSAPANGGTASYATYLWSTSHGGTYYVSNAWDGTYWRFTSNHGAGVRVAYADGAGNASTVAGLAVHGGRNNEANKVVRTDGSGYLQTGYINCASGDENNNANCGRVWGTNDSDNYMRTYRTSALRVSYADSAGSVSGAAGKVGAYASFSMIGTFVTYGSSNVSSINDNGTGDFTLNYTTYFSGGGYAISGGDFGTGGTQTTSICGGGNQAFNANMSRLYARSTGGAHDPDRVTVAVHQ